jgi:cytoskeletal protein RodZ
MRITTIFKAALVISLLALGLVAASWVTGASAQQPPEPPGQGPCSHGNTGKECKPDPSANGKDCDPHGQNGGVNEDHCLATPTTTDVVTTTDPAVTTHEATTTDETTTTNGNATTTTTTTTNGPATTAATEGTTAAATNSPAAPSSSPPTSGVLSTPPVTVTHTATKKNHARTAGVLGSDATASSGQLAFTP